MFTAGNKLIDDHLGAIGKVAKLSLPDHQTLGQRGGITVLKRERSLLGQEGIVNIELCLLAPYVLQRDIVTAIILVMQYSVPVGKGASTNILSGQPNRIPFL